MNTMGMKKYIHYQNITNHTNVFKITLYNYYALILEK